MDRFKISLTFLVIILTVVYGSRVSNPCSEDEYPCDDGKCVYQNYWCDVFGDADCVDESDEKYCKKGLPNNCTDKHFTCRNGICIPISLRCDGKIDCRKHSDRDDNTDEENCELNVRDRSRETKPDNLNTITETPLPISTDYYGRRLDASSSHHTHHLPVNSNPTRPSYGDHNYNSWNRPQNNYNRNSVTYPEGNFLHNQDTTEVTTHRRSHRPLTGTSSRPDRNFVEREDSLIYPPRSILYPPDKIPPSSSRRNVRPPNYSHFYFAKNYTENFEYAYQSKINKAMDWLLSKKMEPYNWGRDTPRALIAISLISNSFKNADGDNELMKKGFQTFLGIKILRNDSQIETISANKLAMYINTLLATCQDPRDFLGRDLVESLQRAQYNLAHQRKFINPLVFLSLCLTDVDFHEQYLERFLMQSFRSEISKDFHILATTALACLSQRKPNNSNIRSMLNAAAGNLTSQMNQENGSFGSKYSTALAAQALMSINSSYWNPRKTLDYLAGQQQRDGSFGDMQTTYSTVIALSGRSFLHLRNTLCDTVKDGDREWTPEEILNRKGERISILYTLRFGYPETFSAGVRISVPINTSFFDIMRIAAYQDPRFKFGYKINNGQMAVHRIANVPNDPERGMFWTLYLLNSSEKRIDFRDRYTEDINSLKPRDGDELVFWYLRDLDL